MSKIMFQSREMQRATPEYRQKVENIKNKLNKKYQLLLQNESNLVKKWFLILKKRNEIKRAIDDLTSYHKMYLAVN